MIFYLILFWFGLCFQLRFDLFVFRLYWKWRINKREQTERIFFYFLVLLNKFYSWYINIKTENVYLYFCASVSVTCLCYLHRYIISLLLLLLFSFSCLPLNSYLLLNSMRLMAMNCRIFLLSTMTAIWRFDYVNYTSCAHLFKMFKLYKFEFLLSFDVSFVVCFNTFP